MSGPQGLVKCCLKVLAFGLPSCLVKGFFPSFIFDQHFLQLTRRRVAEKYLHIKISLLSLFYPARSLPHAHPGSALSFLLLKTPHCLVVAALIPQVPSWGEMKRPRSCRSRIKLRAVFLLGEETRRNRNTGIAKRMSVGWCVCVCTRTCRG